MKSFGIGLALLVAGFALWLGCSIAGGTFEGVSEALEVEPPSVMPLLKFGMYGGAIIGFFGPLYFWLIAPVVKLLRRSRASH
jgi:hypothetical protein